MKFLKLAWDMLGSDFAGRHTQYERFYAGPPQVQKLYSFQIAPWDELNRMLDATLGSYATPGVKAAE
jgi:4-hydroxyphenylacetate 3-monooxygenase